MFVKLIITIVLAAIIFTFCLWQITVSDLNLNITQQIALAAIAAAITLTWLTIFYRSLCFISLSYSLTAFTLGIWLGNIIILIFSAVVTLVSLTYLIFYTKFDRFVASETKTDIWYRGLIEVLTSWFIITVSGKYMSVLITLNL